MPALALHPTSPATRVRRAFRSALALLARAFRGSGRSVLTRVVG